MPFIKCSSLKNNADERNPKINHEIVLIKRHNEIVIGLPNGKEIASLIVSTMEKDAVNESDGISKPVPTKSFWLQFIPTKETYDSGMKDCAVVIIE